MATQPKHEAVTGFETTNRIIFCDDSSCSCGGKEPKGHRGVATGVRWAVPPPPSVPAAGNLGGGKSAGEVESEELLRPEEINVREWDRERAGCVEPPQAVVPNARPLPPLTQSLQSKMACPHLFAEVLRRGKYLPTNAYAQRGIEIHDAIEQYLKHLLATRQPSDYAYFDLLLEQGYRPEAIEILEQMKEALVLDPERMLAVEPYLALDEQMQPLEVDEAVPSHLLQEHPPAGAAYAGIPDLVTSPEPSTIDVDDWKSWFAVTEADTFQSRLYPLLVFKHYPGAERVRFRLQFVRYGTTRSVEFTRQEHLGLLEKEARRERARLRMLHETVELTAAPDQDKLRQIADEQLQAMPGAHCCWCPLLMSGCPIRGMNPYTDQTREERLRFAVWAQAAQKENARVLRELVAAGGPVEIADGNGQRYSAGYQRDERKRYQLGELLPELSSWAAKHPADDAVFGKLTMGANELDRVLKPRRRAGLAEKLKQIEKVDVGTKWNVGALEEPF